MPGKFVPLDDVIGGFIGIMAGDYDQYSEGAFYMVGDMEEVLSKAATLDM
jgi:F0F1-type ATP synthase beta subunit